MSPGRFEQGLGCARTEFHMSMGGVMKRSMGVLAGMLVAVGCGQPIQEHTTGVELTGGRAGQVAIIPEVDVVGLEELTDRTAGTVFVEEVLMHADGVRVWEPSGQSAELAGSDHFFLRYNPSAGASGLTRLWAPADGRYSDLTVQVGPLSMNQDMLTQLSRERGFDLALLQDASIVIRGMMAVGAAAGGTPGLEAQALKEGCGVACEGTTPDTAPADGAKDPTGTTPDTAPARGEVAGQQGGLERSGGPTALPRRTYRPFAIIGTASFNMGTSLDPVVMEGGGAVRLRLDANKLLTQQSLEDLAQAAREQTGMVVRRVVSEELFRSVAVRTGDVDVRPEIRGGR